MKKVVEFLKDKNLIFKKLNKIDLKLLGSKKKIELYEGVDLHSNYVAVFVIQNRSRFVKKSALELIELFERLKELQEHNYKKKILLISSPLCSKAKEYLKELKWKIYATV